jgi:hypothetical protein
MKARLAISLIFLVTFGMAATLYYVMKNAPEHRHQAAEQMRSIWIQKMPEMLGPFQVGPEAVVVSLSKDISDWNFEVQGENLIIQPQNIQILPAPGTLNAPSEEVRREAWNLAAQEIKTQVLQALKLEANPQSVQILAPTKL